VTVVAPVKVMVAILIIILRAFDNAAFVITKAVVAESVIVTAS